MRRKRVALQRARQGIIGGLRVAMASERELFRQDHRYTTNFHTLDFSGLHRNATFVLSRNDTLGSPSLRSRLPAKLTGDVDVGVFGHCADQCEVVIAAIADAGGELVIASVASFPRVDARTGKTIPADEIVFEPQ